MSSQPATEPLSIDPILLEAVARGEHHDPHTVLGSHPHPDGRSVTVRVMRHLADAVVIVTADGRRIEAQHERGGLWAAVVPLTEAPADFVTNSAGQTDSVATPRPALPVYQVEATYGEQTVLTEDAYRFWPTLGDLDLHLISEGRHERLWEALGARVLTHGEDAEGAPVAGTAFTVWAPNARAVRVAGDFNAWDSRGAAMRTLGSAGVWEIFLPGVGPGARYKFDVVSSSGEHTLKADPMARRSEVPPATASIVEESHYSWDDGQWLRARSASDPHSGPMSIYEVHLGSWRPGLSYAEMAEQLVEYVREHHFTHVEFLPVAEHPFGGSWGYQVSSYYAPTARFGTPDQLRHLIDTLHQAGIGVLLDWVPAHFPKDAWALARFDGTALYEHPDPRRGEHQDWGTLVFDFGRREVRNFLVANALYWLEEFHIDGLRVDAVASMLYLDYSREDGQWEPNIYGGRENLEAISFLQEVNATAYRRNPGIVMIAEESTSYPGVTAPTSAGGLGFGLKWNMGWMNDTLNYVQREPIHRRYHHGELTFSLVYAFSEQFLLPISHDEVVHGKGSLYDRMPGDAWNRLAGVRALLAYQWSHPGKQLLFMGQEFAQIAEWSEGQGLDWWHLDDPAHVGISQLVSRLNEVYRERPALWQRDFTPDGFTWLEASDGDRNLLAYLRWGADQGASHGAHDAHAGDVDVLAAIVNFAGVPHENYRVGLPRAGRWLEVLNSDSHAYGGSGVGNLGSVEAEDVPWQGQPASAVLHVPPMGALWLTPS
ncbi:1,4-alpha-glucan branching protein GlgB [Bogoriella caseilytica]|uniref:1,4-alpha-glucan branching enzyme GlgB n=1 Tax=Bogoriella caseilytica TaxID=56055 RepID=A0A3N2BAH4_9MICO|nr:1,4-alpha-glucan branching protein GlgB [Bogoriella caseilytica]ROR72074.1 1,4-alpha-glucan branching enzyme [Bogoriella caseilytica]